MSEKLTRIRLRHSRYGFMDWGEHSFEDMVRQMRRRAETLLAEANAILEADDNDFDVDLVRGPYVQRLIRHVEPSATQVAEATPVSSANQNVPGARMGEAGVTVSVKVS